MIFSMKCIGVLFFNGFGLVAGNGLFCSVLPVVPSVSAISLGGALVITAPLCHFTFSQTVFNRITTLPAAITYSRCWGYCLHHVIFFHFCADHGYDQSISEGFLGGDCLFSPNQGLAFTGSQGICLPITRIGSHPH